MPDLACDLLLLDSLLLLFIFLTMAVLVGWQSAAEI
jgi:hypothetical protein